MSIIVVESGRQRFGLVVDGLHDSEEIVIKPLGRHLKHCQCLSGATILGDGRVALILDIVSLAIHSKLRNVAESDALAETEVADVLAQDSHPMLLFRNHPEEYFAVSMASFSRIEKIKTSEIVEVGGVKLLEYRGVSMPLLSLEDHIDARVPLENDRLFIIVFEVGAQEVGLTTPHLEDIQEVDVEFDTTTLRSQVVLGSAVIDGNVARIIDLHELTQLARPDWIVEATDAARSLKGNTVRILVAEDSDFFRKQTRRHLESAGYEVVAAVDGLAAWNVLNQGEHFDAVVTDIEMPNMSGLEFCRKIKTTNEFSWMPVIALTALAGEEDRERGQAVGIDDYQVKVNKENLLLSLARLIEQSAKDRTDSLLCIGSPE